jgi:hypothetical protein
MDELQDKLAEFSGGITLPVSPHYSLVSPQFGPISPHYLNNNNNNNTEDEEKKKEEEEKKKERDLERCIEDEFLVTHQVLFELHKLLKKKADSHGRCTRRSKMHIASTRVSHIFAEIAKIQQLYTEAIEEKKNK